MAEWIRAAEWLREQDRARRLQGWADATSYVTGTAALAFVWEPCSLVLGAVLLAGVLVQVAFEARLVRGRRERSPRLTLLVGFALLLAATLLAAEGLAAGAGCLDSRAP